MVTRAVTLHKHCLAPGQQTRVPPWTHFELGTLVLGRPAFQLRARRAEEGRPRAPISAVQVLTPSIGRRVLVDSSGGSPWVLGERHLRYFHAVAKQVSTECEACAFIISRLTPLPLAPHPRTECSGLKNGLFISLL